MILNSLGELKMIKFLTTGGWPKRDWSVMRCRMVKNLAHNWVPPGAGWMVYFMDVFYSHK